jgi:hypothetical protein
VLGLDGVDLASAHSGELDRAVQMARALVVVTRECCRAFLLGAYPIAFNRFGAAAASRELAA